MSTVNKLPDVGRVQGLQLLPDQSGDAKSHRVDVQYTGRTQPEEWHQLSLPLLDALYLLNLLEAMSAENGFDHLRRQPGTPH